MSEIKDLIKLMQEQMAQQHFQMQSFLEAFSQIQSPSTAVSQASIPSFAPFDPTNELWVDYHSRFCTFIGANSVPLDKRAQVFLTNQSPVIYKMLSNLASQQSPPKEINRLSMEEITAFMMEQYNPKRFVVKERFRFWNDTRRNPGETIQELAARIRHDAATCDFSSIRDPQDEALRTRFICSVKNEAVLKSLFKVDDDKLTFAVAVQTAMEVDAAKVAKETAFGGSTTEVKKLQSRAETFRRSKSGERTDSTSGADRDTKPVCYRCRKVGHKANVCRHLSSECSYCRKKGHIEAACRTKEREKKGIGHSGETSLSTCDSS